jgi:orotate phosphoribosyltransferase
VAREQHARRTEEILQEAEALLSGDHFVYINGEHGDGWIDKDAIFPNTEWASELCAMLAQRVSDRNAEIVCGPATGGLIVSQWTAHHLRLPSVFADHGKEQGYDPAAALAAGGPLRPPFVLKRGYDRAVRNRRVLVVDDVVNTGESLLETTQAVRDAGGEVITVAALCTRGNAGADDVGCSDFAYLAEIEIPSWPAAECKLCRDGVPVNTRYAHGADFVSAG